VRVDIFQSIPPTTFFVNFYFLIGFS